MDFQLAWPSISRSFGANGRFVWHDEPVDASLTLGDFLAALNGERSGVKLRLSGAPVKLAFDGTASDQPTLKIDGTLSVEAPSLRDALRWTGEQRVAVRRLRALRAAGAEQHRRRRGLALRRQCRTRRQYRRRRDHAFDRRSQRAGHARGRRARSDALCVRHSPLGRERTQLGSTADRARRIRRLRPRSAALGRQRQDRGRAIGPNGGRRQHPRRQARPDDRRIAGLRRHRQGLARARQRQWRRRGGLAFAIRRCRSGKLPRPGVRDSQARGPRQSGAQHRGIGSLRAGGDQLAQRHGKPHRP